MVRRLLFFVVFTLGCLRTGEVAAQDCTDYFTEAWGDPLDMSNSEDILFNYLPSELIQLTAPQFSGGVVSFAATGTRPVIGFITPAVSGAFASEMTRFGNNKPIDTSRFRYLSIRMSSDRASDFHIRWNKGDGAFFESVSIPLAVGFNTYTIDLATVQAVGSVGNSAWTSGSTVGLQITPTSNAVGATISIDWVQLTPSACDFVAKPTVRFVQPGVEGGEDYFSTLRGNPSNFDSPNDIDFLGGTSRAQIFTAATYTDSAGITRTGDYFEAVNSAGNGDPTNQSVYKETERPIDATRYKIACWAYDILLDPHGLNSVTRVLWIIDNIVYTSDDILNRSAGEGRDCIRLDTVPLEDNNVTKPQWRNPSAGGGVDYWRIDLHEESDPTTYRLNEITLAADHEADSQFAIAIGGDRSNTVTLTAKRADGSEISIGELAANRTSDLFLWNTSALAAGSYTLFARSLGYTFQAPGPVIVDHTSGKAGDAVSPVLQVDLTAGFRFGTSLVVQGFAADNKKLAAVEIQLNGQVVDMFVPNEFDIRARNGYPAYPAVSTAGFRRTIDTSAIAAGNVPITVSAYDAAGNRTDFSGTIVRASDNLGTPATREAPAGSILDVPAGERARTPTGNSTPLSLTTSVSGPDISYLVLGGDSCPGGISLVASTSGPTVKKVRSTGKSVGIVAAAGASIEAQSTRVIRAPKRRARNGSIYVLAQCVDKSRGKVQKLRVKFKSNGTRTGNTRALRSVVNRMKGNLTVG